MHPAISITTFSVVDVISDSIVSEPFGESSSDEEIVIAKLASL